MPAPDPGSSRRRNPCSPLFLYLARMRHHATHIAANRPTFGLHQRPRVTTKHACRTNRKVEEVEASKKSSMIHLPELSQPLGVTGL